MLKTYIAHYRVVLMSRDSEDEVVRMATEACEEIEAAMGLASGSVILDDLEVLK
jgi:RNase P/RNase MRP subunit POP5